MTETLAPGARGRLLDAAWFCGWGVLAAGAVYLVPVPTAGAFCDSGGADVP